MPEITYSESNAKSGGFPGQTIPPVYLIVGNDETLKHEAIDRLRAAALDPSFADFDQESIDLGAGSRIDETDDPVLQILSAAGSLPFGSDRKMVVVTSVQRLSKERQDALARDLTSLGAYALLVLVADPVEYEAGKPKGKQVETSLKKSVSTSGVVLSCEAASQSDLKSRLMRFVSDAGKTIDPRAAEAVLARASAGTHGPGGGGDVGSLLSEAEKLVAYTGERTTITAADAAVFAAETSEENIFRLLDAVGARDSRKALAEAHSLLSGPDRADGVAARTMVMLQRHFRLLSLAKWLDESGISPRSGLPQEVKELLSGELIGFATGQAYRLSSYTRQAQNFSWSDIAWCMERILASDLVMKGIWPGQNATVLAPHYPDEPDANLMVLVAQLCTRERPSVRAVGS